MRRLLAPFVAVVALGCGGAPPPAEAPGAAELVRVEPAASASSPPSPPPAPSAAPSPSSAWVAPEGVPATDHPFSPEDYRRAVVGLARVAEHGREGLPRFDGGGDALIRHLTSPSQLEVLADVSVLASERSALAQGYVSQLPELLKLYLPGSDGLDFPREQVAIVRQLLDALGLALTLSTGKVAGARPNAELAAAQRRTLVGVLGGALSLAGERARYTETQRVELLQAALHAARSAGISGAEVGLGEQARALEASEQAPRVKDAWRAVGAALAAP